MFIDADPDPGSALRQEGHVYRRRRPPRFALVRRAMFIESVLSPPSNGGPGYFRLIIL